jgi:hypothetical protein
MQHKYVFEFKDAYDEGEDRIEIRVSGPIQQARGDEAGNYWTGNYTPDELEAFGVAAIQAADRRRRGRVDE